MSSSIDEAWRIVLQVDLLLGLGMVWSRGHGGDWDVCILG